MPRIVPDIKPIGGGAVKVTWANVAAGDTCEWFSGAAQYPGPASVHITGGPLGTSPFALQGANDRTAPQTLEDAENVAITGLGLFSVRDAPAAIRPSYGAGTGSPITVTMTFR